MGLLRSVSAELSSRSTGPVAVAALVTFLLFGAFVLPGQAAAAQQASGGAGSPDTMLLYTSGDLIRMAEAYGQAGRAAYVRARWTFDLAFPLVYGFFLVTSIGWSLRKAAPLGSVWQSLNLVPIGAVVFDLLENAATSWVMARFPAETVSAATIAPWLTLAKWILVYGSFGILIVALGAALARRARRARV